MLCMYTCVFFNLRIVRWFFLQLVILLRRRTKKKIKKIRRDTERRRSLNRAASASTGVAVTSIDTKPVEGADGDGIDDKPKPVYYSNFFLSKLLHSPNHSQSFLPSLSLSLSPPSLPTSSLPLSLSPSPSLPPSLSLPPSQPQPDDPDAGEDPDETEL